jgi:hypothetical protein
MFQLLKYFCSQRAKAFLVTTEGVLQFKIRQRELNVLAIQ